MVVPVHNVMLDWQQGAALTACLAAVAAVFTLVRAPRTRAVPAFAREATMIAGLYTLWQLAGQLSAGGYGGAFSRARWIEHAEHAVGLPGEASVQRALTGDAAAAHAFDIYYATMHFGVLFVLLLWLFTRHRDRYREVRRVLAVTTLLCLVIQLVPVAPPRLLPGYVDTAAKYGESVYGLGFGADQLSAMPSVHVAWAVLVAWAVWRIASGPGRWLGVAHAAVTVTVVVATANHFWADGIVAVAVVAASAGLCRGAERGWDAAIARIRPERAPDRDLRSVTDSGILPG